MRSKLVSFGIFLLLTSVGNGEQSKVVRYLMNEPVSLFDWGLFQLKIQVEPMLKGRFERDDGSWMVTFNSSYDWDRNRIILSPTIRELVATKKSVSTTDGKEKCREVVNFLRRFFGIDVETGEDQNVLPGGRLVLMLSHSGYTVKDLPEDMGRELSSITVIEATVVTAEVGKEYRPVTKCEGPLVSNKISFLQGREY